MNGRAKYALRMALAAAAIAAIGAAVMFCSGRRDNGGQDEKGFAHRDDADFPEGGVTTLDGRPIDTGYRFRHIRRYPACIAMFLMPTAKSAYVAGDESAFYRKPFETAGIELIDNADDDRPADAILVASQPDWIKGTDFPGANVLALLKKRLSAGGVAALHVDARQLSRGRLKGILEEFKSVFGSYMLWCIGPTDYVVTANGNVLADEVFALFEGEKASEAFAAAGIYTPAEVMSCYVGRDTEVEPGLSNISSEKRKEMTWAEAKESLETPSSGGVAAVRAAALVPYYIPPTPWFMRGIAEPVVYDRTTNAIKAAQFARREFLVGFDDIGNGISTNAVDRWSKAAEINPRDPVLQGLIDVIDLKGRQSLRIGNVGGAMGCYEKLLLICPKNAAIVHNYGICLMRGGHPELAAKVFARAVELDPLTDKHRHELVNACAASGHADIACRQLDVLMKRKPEDPDLCLRAARLLCLKNNKAHNPERAVKLAEEAVRITGWRSRAHVLGLADVYIACGRAKDGMALKRKMPTMRFDR
ncbi:MAG: hypothetical protein II649_10300 [Kiritimatiellae bacterium]|nr:hypothetical protein [Kiritimatiellia bacterium]